MPDEKYIQFVANYDDWVSIKKLKIEPGMDPRTVMEFLAGLNTSLDSKVEANLSKLVDLKKLDSIIAGGIEKGKSEAAVAKALAFIASGKVNSVIKEICAKPDLQKNEISELEGFCRAYAMRKAFKTLGIVVDYSEIEIPGMKRLMKNKGK
jgi:hypothetical protein